MTKLLLKIILVLFLFFISNKIFSQYYKLSDQTKVSVLTCGSGNELYSVYGHTAIRFQDTSKNLDIVYNYGNFDFRTENFYLKFVKGDLQYFVSACSFQDFINEYIATNREVWEQKLIINNFQKQKLFDQINTSLFSEERFYTYKFIDKNCTTMVLDKVNSVFGSKIVSKKTNTKSSYRTVLYSFLGNHFWENFGINIIFGAKVDNPSTKLFLPEELLENLKSSEFKGKPIVEKTIILNKKTSEKAVFSFWNSIYPYCVFFILLVIFNKKSINLIYFTIIGLIGIFFSTVGFYSFHEEIYWNYNVLLFNPSLLILVYFIVRNNHKWIQNLCYLNLSCLIIYFVLLLNKAHLIMMLPMILCSGIILIRMSLANKKLLSTIK